MKKVVFIVGMHRCGTSLLSHCMVDNGFSIGKSMNMDRDWQNPDGYYENDVFTRFHNLLLNNNGCSWNSIVKDNMRYSVKNVKRYRELIEREFNGDVMVLIKDPRLTFFLDFLREVCEGYYDYRVLFLRRDKEECCNSLVKAQRVSKEVAERLYDRTMSMYDANRMMLVDHNAILLNNSEVLRSIFLYIGEKRRIDTSGNVNMKLYRNRKKCG